MTISVRMRTLFLSGRRSWALMALGLATFGLHAEAARIVKIAPGGQYVIVTSGGSWALHEAVCLFDTIRRVACGIIARRSTRELGIRLTQPPQTLKPGTLVSLRRASREPAQISGLSRHTSAPADLRPTVDVAGGLSAGFNYFYPMLHFQWGVSDSLSLGLMPMYCTASDSAVQATGFGAFLTMNYYYAHVLFRGISVQGGVGFYSMSADNMVGGEKNSPFAVALSLQWRGKTDWGIPLEIGAGVGGQYVFSPDSILPNGFSGLLPLFTVNLGFGI